MFIQVQEYFLLISAFKQFNTKASNVRVLLKLTDNLNTPISYDIFADIVKQFAASGSFFVNLNYDVKEKLPATICLGVMPEVNIP